MLYHGSKTYIKGKLEPRKSYEMIDWVYATDDYFYALIRCGNFDITKFLIREDFNEETGKLSMAEIVPGAFKYLFDRPGYIYCLDEKYFRHNRWTEYVSDTEVPIKKIIFIENVWNEIRKHPDKYDIYYYDDLEYWKTVRGGKEGYLERKRKVIENIKKQEI